MQDFEVINIDNNNYSYVNDIKYPERTTNNFKKINPLVYNDNIKGKNVRNKYIIKKSNSYDRIIKRKIRHKKYNNNFIKDNTYDEILLNDNKHLPLLNNKEEIKYEHNITEKPKTPIISSLCSKIKSQKLFFNIKTPNTDLNKIYNNNSFYCSKYEKYKQERNKTEEKPKKDLDNISENNCKSSESFSRQKTKKKLKLEEKLELLKQINKENRDKSKKKRYNQKK